MTDNIRNVTDEELTRRFTGVQDPRRWTENDAGGVIPIARHKAFGHRAPNFRALNVQKKDPGQTSFFAGVEMKLGGRLPHRPLPKNRRTPPCA